MNKFHDLACFDEKWILTLDFDQKVKVWLFSIQSKIDQLTGKFICQSCAFGIFWTCWACQDNSMGSLSPYVILVCHWLGQTVKNCLCAVKTLKMTILPFWWSDQISCGIVIQTWPNGSYEFIMLMWIKFHEVWLSIGHSWLFPQYSWFLGQLSNWLGKTWNQGLKLDVDKLGSPIWSMKVILGILGQNIFVQTQTLIWVHSARRSLEQRKP